MEQNPLPPAKKNSNFPMTQPINQDVMELVAGGGNPKNQKVDAAKEQIKKIIAEQKIDPRQLIRVGQLANFALQNNSLYPMVMEQMVKEGLADPEDAQQPPDFKALAGLVSSGKIAEMLINESQQK